MLRAVLFPVLLLACALAARAQDSDRIAPLYQALGLSEIVGIMRREGLTYGEEMAGELFDRAGGPGWSATVRTIYRQDRLEEIVRSTLARELAAEDVEAMTAFFASDRGQRIIGLEISAREAMLAPEVDTTAREVWGRMRGEGTARAELLRRFAEVNDLLEYNVVGAMNSNYAFYQGLSEGGAFDDGMSQEEMLADVWGQEAAIRAETEEWLFAYLALAYQPLDDADIEAYIAFSETDAGQALNRAIFNAFDVMYVAVSRALGAAAASYLTSQEL